jgi:hypothetical protein
VTQATFTAGSVIHTELAADYRPRWLGQMYATDLDRDGNSDLLLIGASYPFDGAPVAQPSLLALGTAAGSYTLAPPSVFPFPSLQTVHPREVLFADFNNDGDTDVFVGSHGYDAMPFPGEQNQLMLSNGDGSWRNATGNLPAVADFTHSASTGDVNGDGFLDIVVGNTPQPNPVLPHVLLNDGTGAFSRRDDLLPTGRGGALDPDVRRLTSLQLGDLDGDGAADLVLGSAFSTAARPIVPAIAWNTGGSFAQAPVTALPAPAFFGNGQSVYDIKLVDVNRDGRQDLIMAYQGDVWTGGWELQVLINQGSRSFVDRTTDYLPAGSRNGGTPSGSDPQSQYWVQFVNIADINADGLADFTLDARGSTQAPASLPVAFVAQTDGSFATATVGQLGAGYLFDYSTQFVQWAGNTGFVHAWLDRGPGKVVLDVIPVSFAPVTPQLRIGSPGADNLSGGTGNDTLEGLAGHDRLDGGAGSDAAVYAIPRSGADILRNAQGLTVTDRSGALGSDTLLGIERLHFADGKLAFDLTPAEPAGRAALLLGVLFPAGLAQPALVGAALGMADSGLDVTGMAQALVSNGILAALAGSTQPADVARLALRNVLRAEPQPALVEGIAAYMDGRVASYTPAQFIGIVAGLEPNQAAIDLSSLQQSGLAFA